jgi:hypothetical protein
MPDHTPPPRWTEAISAHGEPLTITHHIPEKFAAIQPIDDLPQLTPEQFGQLVEGCFLWALRKHGGTLDPRYPIHWDTSPLDGHLRLYITGYGFRTTLAHPIPRSQWSRY